MTLLASNKRGFTLIELLAVITIMAIVVAVAVPSLRSFQSTAMQTAARQLTGELQLARQYAITKRTPVRFTLALEPSDPIITTDKVCRAYCILAKTNDVDGNEIGWVRIQDWKFLPEAIVFSDLNNTSYSITTLPTPPTLGNSGTRIISSSPGGAQYFNLVKSMYYITNSVTGAGGTITTSAIEYRPHGVPSGISATCAGLRLVQGVVLDPSNRTILVNDTNNWVYVEIDGSQGRVRTRRRDAWQ